MLGVYLFVKFRCFGITFGTLTVCKRFTFDGKKVVDAGDWAGPVPDDARVLWSKSGVTLKVWPQLA
jgi:hypothetical protein